MPVLYPWQPNAALAPVLQCLESGGCVGVPTESTYEITASALRPDAVARLHAFANEHHLPAIVLTEESQLRGWTPLLRGAGPRLYRKLGSGPLVVRADGGFTRGLWARLPDAVRLALAREHQIALRWPAHPVWAELRRADVPLVSVPLPSARTADEAARQLHDTAAFIVDAGPTEYGTAPSIAQVSDRRCVIEREGALAGERIQELALCRILFVCTGNTCRSPMAEALCAKLLADRLGCTPGELQQHGFCVQSAGVAAMMGNEASPDAVTVVADIGADLASHRSQMITLEMLAWADHILVMTKGHWHALRNVPVTGLPEPQLLSPQGEDVADPIGGPLTDYRACAAQMLACLQQRLPELLES